MAGGGLRFARAAGAAALRDLVAGPERTGVVITVGSRAAVIELGIEDRRPSGCVCVLGPDAAGLPNGLRLDSRSTQALGPVDLATGTPVTVGAGYLRTDRVAVRVVRWWESRVPVTRPSRTGLRLLARAAADAELGVPRPAVDALEPALVDAEPAALTAAVDTLVGLGRGTTPGGDDLLAGTCVGLYAAGRVDLVARLAAAGLARPEGRTATLSADLLRLALAGHAGIEALAVLRALHGAGQVDARLPAVRRAVQRLLSVGHTSGADLTAGLVLGLSQATTEEGRCQTAHTRSGFTSAEVSTTTR